tara:strand:+ start:836 stop:1198 length:363 start_codon:yes stop_codon:yes gene_type:complete
VRTNERTVLNGVPVKIGITLNWEKYLLAICVLSLVDDNLASPAILDRPAANCALYITAPKSRGIVIPLWSSDLDCEGGKNSSVGHCFYPELRWRALPPPSYILYHTERGISQILLINWII